MRKINLKFDKEGNIIGADIKADLTPFVRMARNERKENPKGWTRQRKFRKVASIPMDIFLSLSRQEQEVVMHGSKRALKRILRKYPVFQVSEGSF